MVNIVGTIGNETLIGTMDDDTIFGDGGDDTIDGGAGDDIIYGDSADSDSASGPGVPGTGLGDGPGSTGGTFGDRSGGQTVYDGRHNFSTDAFFLGNDIPVLNDFNSDVINGQSYGVGGVDRDGNPTDRAINLQEISFAGAQRGFYGQEVIERSDLHGSNDQISSDGTNFQDIITVSSGRIAVTMNDGEVFASIETTFAQDADGNTFMFPSDGQHPRAFNAFLNMLNTNDSGIASFEIVDIRDPQNGVFVLDGNWADGQFLETTDGADGNDVIDGGDGSDTIFGEGGDDTIDGGAGDDVIYGDSADSASAGGAGVPGTTLGDGPGSTGKNFDRVRGESEFDTFDFTTDAFYLGNDIPLLDGPDFRAINGETFSQTGTGGDRTFTLDELSLTGGSQSFVGVITIDRSDLFGANTSVSSSLTGPQDLVSVNNGTANFRMNDGQVFPGIRITYIRDEDGNTFLVPGDTASPGAFNSFRNLLATNDSGIQSFTIATTSDTTNGILVIGGDWADGQFLETTDGDGGDDMIIGGEGADQMFGEGGDDTFVVNSSSEGAGDVISGGNGPDETTDFDVLDLRGAGQVTIDEAVDATDAGATAGTVTFADGSILEFRQIEEILSDTNQPPEFSAATGIDNDNDSETAQTFTDVDDLPVFAFFDPESTNVLDVDAIDPDGDDLTFLLTGGDVGLFEIDAVTGVISANEAAILANVPDFSYDLTITVEDGNGGVDTLDLQLVLIA